MEKKRLTKEEKVKRNKHRRRMTLGVVFFSLCVIGVVSIVSLVSGYVSLLFDDTDDKLYFQELIAPVVSLDPAPFDSIEKADHDMLLQAAIWATITGEDTTKYERNEEGKMILPTVDIDRYATKMYGSNYTITHKSFTDLDFKFEYVADKQAYLIPITGQVGSFMPVVESIEKNGNTKTLTVAYMYYSNATSVVPEGSQAEQAVAKRMEYVMLKEGREYYLYAVVDPKLAAKGK